jgi:hypothetical protein
MLALLVLSLLVAVGALTLSAVAFTHHQPGPVGPPGTTGSQGAPGPTGPAGATGQSVPAGVYVLHEGPFGGCPAGTSGSLGVGKLHDDRGNDYDLCQLGR